MSETSKSTLTELRELNIQKQKAARTAEESHMTGNMTDHMTDQEDDKTASHTEIQPDINTTVQPASQPDALPSGKPARRAPGPSVRKLPASPAGTVSQSIRESLRQAQQKPVLKTVTIKLNPDLDEKVEAHCFAMGRLKQDVIRDALMLYFETIDSLEE